MSGAIPDPISRRDMLRRTTAGMATLALGTLGTDARPPARPPNIVFILADDLGFADVACYGRPDLRTPNVDHLAAQGVRFLQAYANSAVCTATRVALITGRYQYRLRVGLEEPLVGNTEVGLEPSHPTLPSLLRKAGYSSTLVGKWHLGELPKFGPLQSGYDHFYGFRGGAVDYYSHASPTGKDDFWDQEVPVQQAGYLTELLGEPGRRRGERLRPVPPAVHAQPPLQRAALALGSPGRPSRVRAPPRGAQRPDASGWRVAEDLSADDRGDGPADRSRPPGAAGQGDDRRHDRRLHQRQRRRALLRHLALHREEDRAAGGRVADSRGDLLARPHPAGPHDRPGGHQHGLAPDPARRRRHRSRIRPTRPTG